MNKKNFKISDFPLALPSLLIDALTYLNTICRRDRRGKKPDTRYASRFTLHASRDTSFSPLSLSPTLAWYDASSATQPRRESVARLPIRQTHKIWLPPLTLQCMKAEALLATPQDQEGIAQHIRLSPAPSAVVCGQSMYRPSS